MVNIKLREKYNKWTVVGFEGKNTQYIICECDCGTIKKVRKSHLLSGNSKSCGCLQKEKAKELKYKHRTLQNKAI